MADKNYIDPKGYWACPEGGIRRMSDEDGEQEVIVKKTDACSEAEWKRVKRWFQANLLRRLVPGRYLNFTSIITA
jgi:hypothetical protein